MRKTTLLWCWWCWLAGFRAQKWRALFLDRVLFSRSSVTMTPLSMVQASTTSETSSLLRTRQMSCWWRLLRCIRLSWCEYIAEHAATLYFHSITTWSSLITYSCSWFTEIFLKKVYIGYNCFGKGLTILLFLIRPRHMVLTSEALFIRVCLKLQQWCYGLVKCNSGQY